MVLYCDALGCFEPACALGMVTEVHGGVLWSAGMAFCENVKNVIFRHFVFSSVVFLHTCITSHAALIMRWCAVKTHFDPAFCSIIQCNTLQLKENAKKRIFVNT